MSKKETNKSDDRLGSFLSSTLSEVGKSKNSLLAKIALIGSGLLLDWVYQEKLKPRIERWCLGETNLWTVPEITRRGDEMPPYVFINKLMAATNSSFQEKIMHCRCPDIWDSRTGGWKSADKYITEHECGAMNARLTIEKIGTFEVRSGVTTMHVTTQQKSERALVRCLKVTSSSREQLIKFKDYVLAEQVKTERVAETAGDGCAKHIWNAGRFDRYCWMPIPNHISRIKYKDVILAEGQLGALQQCITQFLDSEEEYQVSCMNYKLVILFHGVKRAGKNRLCEAISNELKWPIYQMNKKSLAVAHDAFRSIPPKSLVLLHECDLLLEEYKPEAPKSESLLEKPTDKLGVYLDLLSILDGDDSILHGKIVIMTTNHIDKIDDRLRERVNFKLEFGYCTKDQVDRICAYRQFSAPQNFFVENKNCQYYMDEITKAKTFKAQ